MTTDKELNAYAARDILAIDASSSTAMAAAKVDVDRCSELLARHGLTVAFAESATAGYLSFLFSLTARSGDVLKGGIICYDVSIKEKVLHVPPALIERFTPESFEVSAAIADSLSHIVPADVHVGITGLTKPGGSESREKPVGTMFIVVKTKDWEIANKCTFGGTEQQIIAAAASNLCRMIERKISLVENVNRTDMEEKMNESTPLRPEGERIVDAPLVTIDLPRFTEQLKNEAAWHTGSRNAITVFKSEQMRIVLIALHNGAELPRHTADGTISIQVLEGNIRFETDAETVLLAKGQLVTLHEHIPHRVFALEESLFLLTLAPTS